MKNQWAAVLLAAVILWFILGRQVNATVTVPTEDIKIKLPASAPGAYPVDTPATDYAGTFGPGDSAVLEQFNPGPTDLKQAPSALAPIELLPEQYAIA